MIDAGIRYKEAPGVFRPVDVTVDFSGVMFLTLPSRPVSKSLARLSVLIAAVDGSRSPERPVLHRIAEFRELQRSCYL
jgi:hypothetical protein